MCYWSDFADSPHLAVWAASAFLVYGSVACGGGTCQLVRISLMGASAALRFPVEIPKEPCRFCPALWLNQGRGGFVVCPDLDVGVEPGTPILGF